MWGPVLAHMAALYWISSLSDPGELPPGVSDKVAHFVAYAVLGTLALRACAGGRWVGVTGRAAVRAAGLAAAYGAFDEIHQRFTVGRHSSMADWVADALGACAAVTLGLVLARFARRLKRRDV